MTPLERRIFWVGLYSIVLAAASYALGGYHESQRYEEARQSIREAAEAGKLP